MQRRARTTGKRTQMRARAAAKPVKRRASAAQPRKAAAANSTTGPRNASDEAVSRATGKTWKQWFTILDAARASTLDHKGVVAIAAHHGAGAWWQQMVAVEYEQARGLRRKHEKPSGFQISKSVTLAQPIAKVYAGWSDPRARMRWLEESIVIRKETPQKTMRITWSDGTTHVEAYFWNRAPQKCQVTVQHSKLPDEKAAERMKRFWGSALARFARSLN